MNNIILAITLVVAFFMCINSYILGLKHGKQLVIKEIPTIRSPVQIVKEIKQEHETTKQENELIKEEKIYQEGLQKLMSYTGDVAEDE